MVELPEYVKNDVHIKVYKKLNQDNTIIGMWERKKDPRDFNEEVDSFDGSTKILTHYYGEWQEVPEERITELNKEIREKNKNLKGSTKIIITPREKDLIAARSLLERLYRETGGGEQ